MSKGQINQLEALFAIVLVASVLITTASTIAPINQLETPEDRLTQEEIRSDADVILKHSLNDGSVKHDVLNWNVENDRYEKFIDSQDEDGLYLTYTSSSFGNRLIDLRERHVNETERDMNINVELIPADSQDSSSGDNFENTKEEEIRFITTGGASQQSISVEREITLHGSDTLRAEQEEFQTQSHAVKTSSDDETQLHELESDTEFPIPPKEEYSEIDEDDVYNVVTVRVIVWI